MHPTRKIFVFLLLIYLNGFGFFQSSLVSAFDHSLVPEVEKHLENVIDTTKVSVAKHFINTAFKSFKPLTVSTTLDDTCLLNQTKTSLDVSIVDLINFVKVSGGVLGLDSFKFYKFSLIWKSAPCNATHNLESQVFIFNSKYGSFERAMDVPGAAVVMKFPIGTNSDFSNPKFDYLGKVIENKIKKPGDWTKIQSKFTYTWFVNFPYGSIYHSYTAKLIDVDSGKKYIATVIELPMDPRVNYISQDQFKILGKILSPNSMLEEIPLTHRETHKGICVLYLSV
ncbi:uncharacterized protein LOC135837043 isoform X2 [Planococcus citri]|uniref:uncharacterized protein LOC135837043 isoform X2 n=1 Tax=Planococcus citri TaxID=170843 RepID=UPI0031F96128